MKIRDNKEKKDARGVHTVWHTAGTEKKNLFQRSFGTTK
jgi:hypothetical protein